MCGRTRCTLAPETIESYVKIPRDRWKDRALYKPSYNIGPGDWLPILRNLDNEGRILQTAKYQSESMLDKDWTCGEHRWGLMPSYMKKQAKLESFTMFNARSERLMESPVFRRLVPFKRCVVLLNGFYEWKKETSTRKQPYYVHQGEENVVKLAGLFDIWEGEQGVVCTTTIITTDSSPRLKWLHSRMPVILPDEQSVDLWLTQSRLESAVLDKLLVPYNGKDLIFHPVTPKMGRMRFQTEECCKDVRLQGLAAFVNVNEDANDKREQSSRQKKVKSQDEDEAYDEEFFQEKRQRVEPASAEVGKRDRPSKEDTHQQKKMKMDSASRKSVKKGQKTTDGDSPKRKRMKSADDVEKDVMHSSSQEPHTTVRRSSARLSRKTI